MNFVKVAHTTDLTAGNKKKISLGGKEILLTNIQNSYYAIDNTCPHMGGSLYDGNLDGSQIICPRHGSIFDVTTGKVLQNGKLLFFKAKVHDLHVYPVKIEGTDLLIGIE
ncbi:Rieske 2Fe-2S domain-containing protein [Oscillospiraceae bacterium CM]|nr:Rieske 2Fe-2S domain-containing protein [Oscillospiraceae bacterium CM]